MKLTLKIAAPVVCLAVLGAIIAIWQVKETQKDQLKLTADARICRSQAEAGDASAETRLGTHYYEGRGVSQDFSEAARWYRKAADQNFAPAEDMLGWMYVRNLGVAQDYAEAIRLYRKAANQGDAQAQNHLGVLFYEGRGVTQDYAEASRWYRLSADRGFAKAQSNLGYAYAHGQGLNQDSIEADRWYRKAADQGDESAQRALGMRGPLPSFPIRVALAVGFVGCLAMLIGEALNKKSLQLSKLRRFPFSAIFGLGYLGLTFVCWYPFASIQSAAAINALYFTKSLMAGVFWAMVLSAVWPRIVRILLGASVALLAGFILLAIAHFSRMNPPSVARGLCMIGGLIAGLTITSAYDLWRARKDPGKEEIVETVNEEPDSSAGVESEQS